MKTTQKQNQRQNKRLSTQKHKLKNRLNTKKNEEHLNMNPTTLVSIHTRFGKNNKAPPCWKSCKDQ